MADKTPLKATFFAFQRREPGGALIKATLAYLIISLVIGAAFYAINWRLLGPVGIWYLQALQTPVGEGAIFPNPPSEMLLVLPSYLVVLLAAFILLAAYEAACLRWMIRGETEGFFGLSLGADTWRVWAGYWLWLLVAFGLYVGVIVFIVAVGFGAGLAAGVLGSASALVTGLGVFLAVIIGLMTMLRVIVRLAPAAATSIALQKFSFFKAWTVTRGRFWALFGAFFLLSLIFIVATMIIYGGLIFSVLGAAVGDVADVSGPASVLPQTILSAIASPTGIATLVFCYLLLIVVTFAVYIAYFGVNARAAIVALEEGRIEPAA